MLKPIRTNKFKKEFAADENRGRNMDKLIEIMGKLIREELLPLNHRDHPLHGKWKKSRDCHIEGDWVLVYEPDKKSGTITFQRLGTHSELFV